MNKEERQKKIKAKEESYYSLRSDLDNMLWRLKDLKGYRGGRSYAFKMLDAAINLALEQVRKDYDRYVIRIRRIDANEDVGFMQKALNREKLKHQADYLLIVYVKNLAFNHLNNGEINNESING